MRIMVLNYEFPPVGGGGGRVAADFSRYLASFGHEVRVETSWHPSLPRREVRDGYTIARHFAGRRRLHICSVPEMAAYLLLTLAPTLKDVYRWRPDILHVHFAVPSGVLAWIIHRLTGIPYVLSVHLGDVPGGVPEQTDHIFRWIKPLTGPIWQDAGAVATAAPHIQRLARKSYDVPVILLPNGIDVAGITPSPTIPGNPVRLVFAGRFSLQKNPLFLFQALAGLRELPWHLDVLGDGPLKASAESLAHELGLTAKVHFHGWVSPEAFLAIMQHSDILLMPSRSEGLPMVGVTALAAGLAILGSRVGGVNDLVEPGRNGFLVPVDDAPAFAQRLKTMLDPEILAGMKRASRHLAHRFDLAAMTQRLEEIMVACLAAR